jgi:hypothetical protein
MRDIFSLRFYDEFGNGIIFEDKDWGKTGMELEIKVNIFSVFKIDI